MAKETARFEAPSPYKADTYDFHSLIKSEFIDDSALSEEENYSSIANIQKETIPLGHLCLDKYIPYIKKLVPDSTQTLNLCSKTNSIVNHQLNEYEIQTKKDGSTEHNLSDKENIERDNEEVDQSSISNSKQVLADYVGFITNLADESKGFHVENSLISSKSELKSRSSSSVITGIRNAQGNKTIYKKYFIYDTREKTKPTILSNCSKNKFLTSNVVVKASEKAPSNVERSDLNCSTTMTPNTTFERNQTRDRRKSSLMSWFSSKPMKTKTFFLEETKEKPYLLKENSNTFEEKNDETFLKKYEDSNKVSDIPASPIENMENCNEELKVPVIEKCTSLEYLDMKNKENCLQGNDEASSACELFSQASFEIENEVEKTMEEYFEHAFTSELSANMLEIGNEVELPSQENVSILDHDDNIPNDVSSLNDYKVIQSIQENLNSRAIAGIPNEIKIGANEAVIAEDVLKNNDDSISKYACDVFENCKAERQDHNEHNESGEENKANKCELIPKLICSIELSKLKQLTKTKNGTFWRKAYKCDICGKIFNKFNTWQSHLSVHYTPCNFCKARFIEFEHYVAHVHETHAMLPFLNVTKLEVKDFAFFMSKTKSCKKICILCKKVLLTREMCIQHIMKCHSYEVFTWKDKGVTKKLTNNSFFLKKFAFAIDCPLCKLCFERESDFHSHMQSYHNSHTFCVHCNLYVFNSKLPIHTKKHAKEERQWNEAEIEYSCACCALSCSSSEQFEQHLNKVQCSYCPNAKFCSQKAFEDHRVDEHTDKLFGLCSFCDIGFYTLEDLLEHMTLAHSSSSECEDLRTCRLCITASSVWLRYYTSRESLAQHMLFHCILSNVQCNSSPEDMGPHIDILPHHVKWVFRCILCSDTDPAGRIDIESFIFHLTKNHPNALLGFCDYCRESHSSTDALLHPVLEHFISSGLDLICSICNSSYETPASALHHAYMSHYTLVGQIPLHIQHLIKGYSRNPVDICFALNNSPFECDPCGLYTDGLLDLIVHLNTIHSILRIQITCKICQTSNLDMWSFIVHVCVREPTTHRGRKRNHKAIIQGLLEPSETPRDITDIISVGNYSGISGEHNYTCLERDPQANTELVHEEHNYCGEHRTKSSKRKSKPSKLTSTIEHNNE